ncbi:MAG: PorT family protein [Bacteroidales bacterium]|nr:PorT family protein [Bacteroidales bacterium]MCM1147808.1 PorT family protein [Bacteroidales bacterium]MCM1206456.1 PorT family protein [Bacillota bacterium]MCM1510341.1 PorT family protein [Clostridium sp.]
MKNFLRTYRRYLSVVALTTLHLLSFPLHAEAQVGDYRNDFAIGFNGGYQLNKIAFESSVPQDMLGGMNFGFTARYTCEKYFNTICAIQMEVNYAELGWKDRIESINGLPCILQVGDHQGEPAAYQRTISYIQIPLLAHLGWGREEKGVKFFLNMGPQFGFMLSETSKTNFRYEDALKTDPERVSLECAQDSMPVENKFDFGITAGLGLELSLKRAGHIALEARYYYGLGNIYGDSKQDHFSRSNHNNIVFKATYLFDIIRTKNAKRKK